MTPGPTRQSFDLRRLMIRTQHIHELSNETKREVMIQKEQINENRGKESLTN
jgi:hypothetical protein